MKTFSCFKTTRLSSDIRLTETPTNFMTLLRHL